MSVGTSAGTALTTAATSPHVAHRKLAAAPPVRCPNLDDSVTWRFLPPSKAQRPDKDRRKKDRRMKIARIDH
jgi:hypothetical protein